MSAAKTKFNKSISEVTDLIAIHATITTGAVGRPNQKVAVLNKSGIVLICAFWQAYCEDVLFEALLKLKAIGPDKLPAGAKAVIATRVVKSDKPKDVTGAWKLAAQGWKQEVTNLVTYLEGDKTRPLNTPNSENVADAFKTYLSIEDISMSWKWPKMKVETARKTLDEFILKRHRVAHRGAASTSIKKADVEAFQNHVIRLVEKTDDKMHSLGLV